MEALDQKNQEVSALKHQLSLLLPASSSVATPPSSALGVPQRENIDQSAKTSKLNETVLIEDKKPPVRRRVPLNVTSNGATIPHGW
jgi:hypothetical protein